MVEANNPRRMLPSLLGIDLAISGSACSALLYHEFVSLSVAALVMAARAVIWLVTLERLFAPVQRWRAQSSRGRARDPAALIAADRAMHAAPVRFIAVYAGTWASAIVVLVGLAPAPMSAGEEVAASCITVSIMLASVLLLPVFRSLLGPLYTTLATALAADGVSPERPRIPLITSVVAIFLCLLVATMIGLTGTSIALRSFGLANEALAEQRRLAELDALTPDDRRQGEVVVAADLPPDLQAGDPGSTRVSYAPNLDVVSAAAPLGDGRFVVHRASYHDDSWLMSLFAVFSIAVSIVPSILAGIALNRVLLEPLRALEAAARSVAEQGKLRDQARVVTAFDDEIGDVAHSFNAMLDVLEQLAAAAAAVTEGNLQIELVGPGDLQDSFRAMIARLDEVVVQIRVTALEAASAAAEIQAATQEQERATEQQSVAIRQVGASVASLADSADAISVAAKGVLSNAEQTRITTEDTVSGIAELEAHTRGIAELLELIRDVADRSDLLALNGSLEAVRAGEAGRGFALVAAEMRRLAERVSTSIDDVAAQVNRVQHNSAAAVTAMSRSHLLADGTAEVARQISTETERQSDATEQLARAVDAVAQVAVATSRATGHTRATAEGLRVHAQELEKLTVQFKTRSE